MTLCDTTRQPPFGFSTSSQISTPALKPGIPQTPGGIPMADDTRDKVVALEVQVEHLAKSMDAMGKQVTAMHEILLQARGAKYVIVASALVGGFISAKLSPFIPWFKG